MEFSDTSSVLHGEGRISSAESGQGSHAISDREGESAPTLDHVPDPFGVSAKEGQNKPNPTAIGPQDAASATKIGIAFSEHGGACIRGPS
jgi:hypothetical protein